MAKYLAKFYVEAVQWFPGVEIHNVYYPPPREVRCDGSLQDGDAWLDLDNDGIGYGVDIYGIAIRPGTWIVKYPEGEVGPLDPDEFIKRFERVIND